MPAPTSSAVPPGGHAPIAVITANDHSAWISICNAFGLAVILSTLLVRLYIRVRVSPPFSADDFTLIGGTALAIIQVGLVFAGINAGFGKSIDRISDPNLVKVQKLGYASDILFIAALYMSKCCVVLFFKRISPSRANAMVSWVVLAACLVFALCSILVVSLRCDLAEPWMQYHRTCTGLNARWEAVAAFDIVSEVALFAMSLHLVWDLQTSITRKSKVVFAFALRLLIVLVAGLRLHYVEQQTASTNPTLDGATGAVLTQVELFYSIVAATIPCLRPFLGAFVTNYGAMGGDTIINGSHIGGSSGAKGSKGSKGLGSSFTLRSLDKNGTSSSDGRTFEGQKLADTNTQSLRPDLSSRRISANKTKIQHVGNDAISVASDESTKGMIIRKDISWQVDSESHHERSVSEMHRVGESD